MNLGDTTRRAAHLLTTDRMQDYGEPRLVYKRAAKILEGMGRPCEPEDIILVMIAVKLARESMNHKTDNLTDLAAYADILNYLEESKV